MGIAGAGGFNHQVGVTAEALPDQMMVHRAGGDQAVNGQAPRGDAAVGQDQDGGAVTHRLLGGLHQRGHGLLQIRCGRVVAAVDITDLESGSLQCQQGVELALGQHRGAQDHSIRMLGALVEDVFLAAEVGLQ